MDQGYRTRGGIWSNLTDYGIRRKGKSLSEKKLTSPIKASQIKPSTLPVSGTIPLDSNCLAISNEEEEEEEDALECSANKNQDCRAGSTKRSCKSSNRHSSKELKRRKSISDKHYQQKQQSSPDFVRERKNNQYFTSNPWKQAPTSSITQNCYDGDENTRPPSFSGNQQSSVNQDHLHNYSDGQEIIYQDKSSCDESFEMNNNNNNNNNQSSSSNNNVLTELYEKNIRPNATKTYIVRKSGESIDKQEKYIEETQERVEDIQISDKNVTSRPKAAKTLLSNKRAAFGDGTEDNEAAYMSRSSHLNPNHHQQQNKFDEGDWDKAVEIFYLSCNKLQTEAVKADQSLRRLSLVKGTLMQNLKALKDMKAISESDELVQEQENVNKHQNICI